MEKLASTPLYCFSTTGGYIYPRSRRKRYCFIKAADIRTPPPKHIGQIPGSGTEGLPTVIRVRGHRRQPGLILSRHAFRLPCTPTR